MRSPAVMKGIAKRAVTAMIRLLPMPRSVLRSPRLARVEPALEEQDGRRLIGAPGLGAPRRRELAQCAHRLDGREAFVPDRDRDVERHPQALDEAFRLLCA